MSTPRIHGKTRTLSASAVRNALAAAVMQIKVEDDLTFADLGRVFGKSEDQAAKYADGTAEMSVTSYYFARREWNGRFTGLADHLLETVEAQDAHKAQTAILKCAVALSVALEDGDLTEREIHANRSTLENAKEAIDKQLARLKPQEVA